jgi:hypothetical protein
MVYDPDVVRAVLLNLQTIPAALEPVNLKKFYRCSVDGRTPEELSEHVRLMTEDRLIEDRSLQRGDGERLGVRKMSANRFPAFVARK